MRVHIVSDLSAACSCARQISAHGNSIPLFQLRNKKVNSVSFRIEDSDGKMLYIHADWHLTPRQTGTRSQDYDFNLHLISNAKLTNGGLAPMQHTK